MRKIIRAMKIELKTLAEEIRTKKRAHEYCWPQRSTFRHRHIVYCLLRGRTIEQIEPKVHKENLRSQSYLEQIWLEVTGLKYPEKPAWPPRAEVADGEALRACAP